MKLESVL